MLAIHSLTDASTRSGRSQSAKTKFGDFPPSSRVTFLTDGADSLVTETPPRVDPVNEIIWISGCLDNATPTSSPVPCIKLNTPAGTPAS